jgi:isopenicillin N synthase-like dioxygenase
MSVVTERAAIPVLDLGAYLEGAPGALDATAASLREALERVGFFFIVNHGVPWPLVNGIFAEARRFHALPLDEKLALKMSKHNTGYVAVGGGVSNASRIAAARKPNLNAAFFMKRDRSPDDPDVVNDVPLRGLNQWPAALPGFREKLREYFATMEAFCARLLPLYARALDLPDGFFAEPFREAQITLRLSHYPRVPAEQDQFGLSPHTDAGFMTLLPDNDVPGLEIRPAGRDWVPAPSLPGSFLVNSGDIPRRWTNDRFLSTEHRVLPSSARDRYAIPFFFDPRTDVVIDCLPTCQGPGDPPKYAPTPYGDYLVWFMRRNYHGATEEAPRP